MSEHTHTLQINGTVEQLQELKDYLCNTMICTNTDTYTFGKIKERKK